MLTEKDYCDYETCVALKELGFPIEWFEDETYHENNTEISLYEAQKWLREKKLLHIVIDKLLYGAYEFSVVDILNYSEEKNGTANSYEEALSEGVRKAIEILKE